MKTANTRKNLVAFGKVRFTVFHINADGSRGLQYGGLSGIKLIDVIFNNIAKGVRMVIVHTDDAYKIHKEVYGDVINNSQRDPQFYQKVLPYSVSVDGIMNALLLEQSRANEVVL